MVKHRATELPGVPENMTGGEALEYCRNVLGWKSACIPDGRTLEELQLERKTVYRWNPRDFFDTPDMFFFG